MTPLFPSLSDKDNLLIAGPCSAESLSQLLSTAESLRAEVGLKLFRAGVWKPRTRPGGFEGCGEEALSWMREVREKTGLLVGTEVGSARHTELALDYGLDFIWIGTRTTTSPFAVEEIAEVLDGKDIAVLVKNPLAPDIDLWIGAIARLLNHGISRVGAILRGFYVGGESALRNIPLWHLADEFRSKVPVRLPLLCDPSHIAGDRAYVPSVIREASKRGFDGLIVESHCKPDEALTDSAQQLLPSELKKILSEISPNQPGNGEDPELVRLRLLLDKIDEEIIRLLRERFSMTDQIGEWKAFHQMEPHQVSRELKLYETRRKMAEIYHIPEKLVDQIYRLVHAEALRRQEEQIRTNQ
ncbi:MAG: chorismate mutase [Porphyromonas sp.]|nr:bifunctional 3-deoxy-7-phosphoheptulonate synthase/chorismate mutase type II [Bacteroidales bacterium]MDD7559555.1 chorismate mutase [Bacteroidales bacterium]MDY3101060.1 chorismate mutase [Porphyromonas sp.]